MVKDKQQEEEVVELDFEKAMETDRLINETLSNEEVQDNNEEPMGFNNPNWTTWVLSELRPDEMFNGNPTVDGLRRITELYIGTIVKSTSVVNQCPSAENQHRATVTHTIEVVPHEPFLDGDGNAIRLVFSGSADVYLNNTPAPFNSYPVATADTRSEGKSLRRLLRLRNVVAAEETSELVVPEAGGGEEKITAQMIGFADVLAHRADVNVKSLVEDLVGRKLKTINELTVTEAQKLNVKLNECQQNKDKVDEKYKGYSAEWRATFAN